MLPLHLPPSTAVIDTLSLSPNPQGGWSRHLPDEIAGSGLGPHVVNYLLTVDSPIAFHRLSVDSMYYFHQGCPLAVQTISLDGVLGRTLIGSDLHEGQRFQCAVPAGWWRAFKLMSEPWALMSAVVASSGASALHEFATTTLFPRQVPHLGMELERSMKSMTEQDAHRSVVDFQARLDLEPNLEGGFFRQTYESAGEVATAGGSRPVMNSIFYLLTTQSPMGSLHRNRSVIAHFHHAGDPATYLLVARDGEVTEVVLGSDYLAGQVPAFSAPSDCWKTSWIQRLDGAGACLISEAVVPGFRYDDHEMATLEGFTEEHPALADRFRPYIAGSES